MTYSSIYYLLFIIIAIIVYSIVPMRHRYLVLLAFSAIFIEIVGGTTSIILIYGSCLFAFLIGQLLKKFQRKKIILLIGIVILFGILLALKYANYYWKIIHEIMGYVPQSQKLIHILAPIGISFYTLQLVSYIIDIYHNKIEPEGNFLKFALYTSWFPHILQGPIARYDKLSKTLYNGASVTYYSFTTGFQLALWGIAKKIIIADRASIFVNEVYTNYSKYGFVEIAFATILYGIQLYADFSACVDISRGVSQIFGIELQMNFEQPYFATSVKDFWRRWHISLSTWLRDYVFIPLGGSRCSKFRRYVNILTTFAVSGIWHGVGLQFIVWGVLHGIYQVFGNFTLELRQKLRDAISLDWNGKLGYVVKCLITFLLVDFAWLFFRAASLNDAVQMIKRAGNNINLWVVFDQSLYQLGITQREMYLLICSIVVMFFVDFLHEKHVKIRERIASYHLPLRWTLYFVLIFSIIIFGKYGFGYNAADFIYMQF